MSISFFKALCLLFSSSIIIITGYRCAGYYNPLRGPATQGQNQGRYEVPIPPRNQPTQEDDDEEYDDEDYYYDEKHLRRAGRDRRGRDSDDDDLPDENDRCARKVIRDLSRTLGAVGILDFDSSALEDYRMGVEENYPIQCPRIYLNLRQIGSKGLFRGKLAISYQTETAVKVQRFNSGYDESDNENNRWGQGDWPRKSEKSSEVKKAFNAIFEDEDSAIILRIEEVYTKTVRDGKVGYFASGELYFKMFRYSSTAGRGGDDCYRDGTYMRLFNQRRCGIGQRCSTVPRKGRCWKIAHGPYSCLPDGALRPSGGKRQAAPKIDIEGDLRCFRELARFRNLNIEEAFNVKDSIDELD